LKNNPKNFNPITNTLKTFNLNPTTPTQYTSILFQSCKKNVRKNFNMIKIQSPENSQFFSLFIIEISLIIIFTTKVDFEKVLKYQKVRVY